MTNLIVGEQAPWFKAPALDGNPIFAFESLGGRIVLLFFGGSMAWPACAEAMATVQANRNIFDDQQCCFFGVTIDRSDVEQKRIAQQVPGIRWFLDFERPISNIYGASIDRDEGGCRYEPHFLLLDHRLRVAGIFSVGEAEAAIAATRQLAETGIEVANAPILIVPRVFEPELCRQLIELYDEFGGEDSGFMREVNGMTVPVLDHSFKRRSDYHIEDEQLQRTIMERFRRRLLPEMRRAYNFDATRIERWLVSCYDGDNGGGFFNAHRDNTTKGTAHRRFACTINLNAEEFDGGDLCFPEYGPASYRAPTGGAVIFGCGLLHEALPVTRGQRYAFLPFFYDDAAAEIREQNMVYLQQPEEASAPQHLPPRQVRQSKKRPKRISTRR
jgi:peroxiredoxin